MNRFKFAGLVTSQTPKTYGEGKTLTILNVINGDTNIEVACFGKNAKIAEGLAKGDQVLLAGELATRAYTDKSGAQRHALSLKLDYESGIKKAEALKTAPAIDDLDDIPF